MIDLLCHSQKFKLKANLKPWIDSGTISTTFKSDKYKNIFKIYIKFGFKAEKYYFQQAISDKKKTYFPDKFENNANGSKGLWKTLRL